MSVGRGFLCYIYGSGSRWKAICVDLDLAVEAKSQHAVTALLEDTICSYIEDAHKEDPQTCEQLLRRSSPLALRFSLWARYQLYMLTRSKPHSKSFSAIAVPCPALT